MLYSAIFGQYIVRVHWRVLQKLLGLFHKAEKASELKVYSEVFKTAEINSTLYAYPSKGTVMGWLKYANIRLVISPEIPIFLRWLYKILFFFFKLGARMQWQGINKWCWFWQYV